MKFGDRLKKSRLEKGLTQEQVAQNLYVTRQTISGWENEISYPDIINLIKLSDYYQVSLDTLLKEDRGMREYMEKKEVTKSLRPVYNMLMFTDLLLIVLLISNIMDFIKLGILFIPTLFLVLFTVYALNRLKSFDSSSSLGLTYEWQKYLSGYKGLKYALVLPTFIILSGLIISVLKGMLVGGSIFLAGLIILIPIVTKKRWH
ncbi:MULTISPECIES: helix-turn-helix domain-containing protein [Leuconostoc]|uniref:HTH-type transcriptional regulator ImmR n=1 Tax=Leuconostoc suionicum TaxID=1511761 RepID=A0A2N9KET4_9LACO|nr:MULTISPECIES: helix-turn-helix domain-containing protein [Leuconostoc]MCT4402773.1 helix-turn-helix domain-containing protein [Leuconostoc suionicum]MDI6544402.1 helix-turn-helix domain-containing protein [Leuconostoc suionicum]MDV7704223.1 helix-turn-helix domain-containing protein [Leuconostoc suionicum]SPD93686.1 HTH-type transcriptional regulator ImmR [Leuconostoc suionicum]SPE09342.1 HTH-type transcriptional regulator ImmR [Leuconostoc suionicum]